MKNKSRNAVLITETIGVFILMSIVAVSIHYLPLNSILKRILYLPVLLFQGLWFYRFYIVGHEASHRKLFKDNTVQNDIWGSIVLIPLLVPINIYRKIHMFHHGFNRKDDHTSSLDTFISKRKPNLLTKTYYYVIWYISVFCGGFFLHSLISVLLFLFIPPSVSIKISPAFKGWKMKDQIQSIALFSLGLLFHLAVYYVGGWKIYLLVLGLPMLSFAWVLSILVYIFHYDTTKGEGVRFNVRSLQRVPVFSWILMNFNEHATHHQYPNIPWYELPAKKTPLPEEYALKNQNTNSFIKAILQQLKGPKVIYENSSPKSKQ